MHYLDKFFQYKSDGVWHSQERKWYSSDSEEDFEKLTKKLDLSTYNYYLKNPIKYKFNNYGFRTNDDFVSDKEGNVFLGCSHTAGVGLHFDDTWVSGVNEEVGGLCFNLGVPAAAPSTMFRLLFHYKNKLKIKNVFHFSLTANRYEFINDITDQDKLFDYFGAYLCDIEDNNKDFPHDNFIMNSFLLDEQNVINQIIVFNAIKSLCNDIGVNYYLVTDKILEEYTKNNLEKVSHYINENKLSFINARDTQHYSSKKHFYLKNCFLDMVVKNQSTDIDYNLF